jgi:uncharacterized membrane protein
MGLRFRKTIPLGSLFRISLSKSGLSLGMGPRGMNVNIGTRGIRKTIGLPGTGISYQDTQGLNSASTPSPTSPPSAPAHPGVSWLKVIGVVLLVALLLNVLVMLWSGSNKNVMPAAVTIVQSPTPAPQAIASAQGHALSREEVRELQRLLKQLGFKPGQADGLIGPQTRSAARAFAHQFVPGGLGEVDASLLEKARAMSR